MKSSGPAWLRRIRAAMLTLAGASVAGSGFATETLTYTYDARGRLVGVVRSGTVNSGTTECYTYDKADNRTNVKVSTAACPVPGPASPAFSISDASGNEGTVIQFTVLRTGPLSGTDSVKYSTGTTGTATSNVDYTAVPLTTLTFAPNVSTLTVTVNTIQDSAVENNETFFVNLSSPSAGTSISDAQGKGTIINDDVDCTGVSFSSAGGPAVVEGANAVFTVNKSGTSSSSCTVLYHTLDNYALAGSDYVATNGTLTFTPSQTSKTIAVATIDDSVAENPENFDLQIYNAANGATITTANGYVTINDNDATSAPPAFSIDDVRLTEGSTFVFTVTKSGSNTSNISISVATANGTATAGLDYTSATGTLVFGPTDVTKTFAVQTTIDTNNSELDETFFVNLSGAGVTFTDAQGIGTIIGQCSEPLGASASQSSDTAGSTADGATDPDAALNATPVC